MSSSTGYDVAHFNGEIVFDFDILMAGELLHLLQRLFNKHIVCVHQPEGGNVNEVIPEVFHLECLQVEGREQIVILEIVHLELENLS
jgi:hypothetical protein